jgi:hypothetical protein
MAVAAQELPELALAFLPVDPVLLLVLARELIVGAGDHAQPVTGQPAPAFSHAAAQLLPLAFEAIPVHIQVLRQLVHAASGTARNLRLAMVALSERLLCTLANIRRALRRSNIGSVMISIGKIPVERRAVRARCWWDGTGDRIAPSAMRFFRD